MNIPLLRNLLSLDKKAQHLGEIQWANLDQHISKSKIILGNVHRIHATCNCHTLQEEK